MMTMNLCKEDIINILKTDGISPINVERVVRNTNARLTRSGGVYGAGYDTYDWRFTNNPPEPVVDWLNPVYSSNQPDIIGIGNLQFSVQEISPITGGNKAIVVGSCDVFPTALLTDIIIDPTRPKTLFSYDINQIMNAFPQGPYFIPMNYSSSYGGGVIDAVQTIQYPQNKDVYSWGIRFAIGTDGAANITVNINVTFNGWIAYCQT